MSCFHIWISHMSRKEVCLAGVAKKNTAYIAFVVQAYVV